MMTCQDKTIKDNQDLQAHSQLLKTHFTFIRIIWLYGLLFPTLGASLAAEFRNIFLTVHTSASHNEHKWHMMRNIQKKCNSIYNSFDLFKFIDIQLHIDIYFNVCIWTQMNPFKNKRCIKLCLHCINCMIKCLYFPISLRLHSVSVQSIEKI